MKKRTTLRTSGCSKNPLKRGLYLHKNSLIAIQNGVQPNRVLKIDISADSTKIERVDILESNHGIFPGPTLGVVVENDFYYIGNSMIGPYLENPKVELKPAVILKLPLPSRGQASLLAY